MTHEKSNITEILKLLREFHNREVFADFVKIAAIIHQKAAITLLGAPNEQLEREEKNYYRIIKKYSLEEQDKLIKIYALFIGQLEKNIRNKRCDDVLGYIFTQLNLPNKSHGQFFTPEHIAELMSKCIQSSTESPLAVADPCCGSGGLLLKFAETKLKEGMDVGYDVLCYGKDIDELCAMVAFVQLGYYGFSAIIEHGNTLTGEVYKRYFTLVYALYSYRFRNKINRVNKDNIFPEKDSLSEEQPTLF